MKSTGVSQANRDSKDEIKKIFDLFDEDKVSRLCLWSVSSHVVMFVMFVMLIMSLMLMLMLMSLSLLLP